MWKTILIGAAILLLPGMLVPFAKSVVKNIRRFEAWGNLELPETPLTLHPSFTALHVQSGKTDTLGWEGRKLINVWATWCKPCLDELPALHRLAASTDTAAVLLCSFDSAVLQPGILQKLQVKLPVYLLTDSLVLPRPPLFPATYLITDNTLQDALYGAQDWTDTAILGRIRRSWDKAGDGVAAT